MKIVPKTLSCNMIASQFTIPCMIAQPNLVWSHASVAKVCTPLEDKYPEKVRSHVTHSSTTNPFKGAEESDNESEILLND